MVSNTYGEWRVQKLAAEQAPPLPNMLDISDTSSNVAGQH
jgi:hypothetical protein